MKCPGYGPVEVISVDAHARRYRALYQRLGFEPPEGYPESCALEDLWREYPEDYFDLVYCSNALDHTVHPLEGIRMMIHVLKEGSTLLLWRFQDVHPEEWKTLSDGQHQWGMRIEKGR